MKSKFGWVAIACVVVLIASVLGLRLWFISPGIHVLGKDVHIELTQTCFIIDGLTDEVVDETTVLINGSTKSGDAELFEGDLKIVGYQNSSNGTITSLKALEVNEAGGWILTHLENCTHQENVNGIIQDVEHFCDYSYTYYIPQENPEDLIVLIESFAKDQPQYAVCAASEEDALLRYQAFVEERNN